MCWKEIFPNEDAARFDLVDELYTLPAKLPTSMFQVGAWLEDWMTKLVAADEVSAHIEPRRATAVLMNAGKPLQTSDNIFMTEWVAIFRKTGLRDDATVANLQDACLKLVVLARARARELQGDQQVERAQQPLSAKTAVPMTKPKPQRPTSQFAVSFANQMDARLETIVSMHIPILMGSVCDVKPAPKKTYAKPNGKAADAQSSNQGAQDKKKAKGKSKGKDRKTKPTAKSGEIDFDENARLNKANQTNLKSKTKIKKKIVIWTRMACLIGLIVGARITKTASWRPLHVHLQTLQ